MIFHCRFIQSSKVYKFKTTCSTKTCRMPKNKRDHIDLKLWFIYLFIALPISHMLNLICLYSMKILLTMPDWSRIIWPIHYPTEKDWLKQMAWMHPQWLKLYKHVRRENKYRKAGQKSCALPIECWTPLIPISIPGNLKYKKKKM